MKNWQIFSILKKRNNKMLIVMLALLVILGIVLSLCVGAVSGQSAAFAGKLTDAVSWRIFMYIRLPRTCGALLAGMALATSGSVIQSVLANPLAAPNIIGVNAGAGLGVTLCSALLPASLALVPAAAFAGALAAVMLVLLIVEKTGASRITLVLAGVAISSIFSAGTDAVITFFPDALAGYTDFRIGGLAGLVTAKLVLPAVVITAGLLIMMLLSHELDVMMLGNETALSLGLPVRRLRVIMLSVAAALAGAAVSFAGLLGFVGLLAPQIMRRIVGDESRFLIPASALGGAALVLYSDLLSRTLFAPYELPVGILLSCLGGPFFLWLLFRQRGGRIHD